MPYLIVRQLEPMVDFLRVAFGATELFRTPGGDGGTHVELRIGDSIAMIGGGEGGRIDARHALSLLGRCGCCL